MITKMDHFARQWLIELMSIVCAALCGQRGQHLLLFMIQNIRRPSTYKSAANVGNGSTNIVFPFAMFIYQKGVMIFFVLDAKFQQLFHGFIKHNHYINTCTCTSDNILTILLMYCHQFNELVQSSNLSQAEDSEISNEIHANRRHGQGKVNWTILDPALD